MNASPEMPMHHEKYLYHQGDIGSMSFLFPNRNFYKKWQRKCLFGMTLNPFNHYILFGLYYSPLIDLFIFLNSRTNNLKCVCYMGSIWSLFLCNLPNLLVSCNQPNLFMGIKSIIKQYRRNSNFL